MKKRRPWWTTLFHACYFLSKVPVPIGWLQIKCVFSRGLAWFLMNASLRLFSSFQKFLLKFCAALFRKVSTRRNMAGYGCHAAEGQDFVSQSFVMLSVAQILQAVKCILELIPDQTIFSRHFCAQRQFQHWINFLSKTFKELISAISGKMGRICAPPALRNIFGCFETFLDFSLPGWYNFLRIHSIAV